MGTRTVSVLSRDWFMKWAEVHRLVVFSGWRCHPSCKELRGIWVLIPSFLSSHPKNLPRQAPSAARVGELPEAAETRRLKTASRAAVNHPEETDVQLKVVLKYWCVSQQEKNKEFTLCVGRMLKPAVLATLRTTTWLTCYTWVGERGWYLTRRAHVSALRLSANPTLIGYESRLLLLMYTFGCLEGVMIITEGVTD